MDGDIETFSHSHHGGRDKDYKYWLQVDFQEYKEVSNSLPYNIQQSYMNNIGFGPGYIHQERLLS